MVEAGVGVEVVMEDSRRTIARKLFQFSVYLQFSYLYHGLFNLLSFQLARIILGYIKSATCKNNFLHVIRLLSLLLKKQTCY